jgi:long-subunit acyl-CoA synthetase (AMP-forming)
MVHRIDLGATALSAKVSDGGLGLSADGGEMIGLLGENSLVCGSMCDSGPFAHLTLHAQEYIDIVLSLLKVTTPFAPISTFSTRFELVHALKLTKATRLFVDAKLLKNVLAAIDDPDVHITSDKIYILSGPPVKGRQSFNQLIEAAERKKLPLAPIHPAKKDTLAYLVMSSGTSGLPKGVC